MVKKGDIMKKILSVLLVIALLFSLAACGNNDSGSASQDNNSSTQSEDNASSDVSSNTSSDTSSKTSSKVSSQTSSEQQKLEEPQFTVYTDDVYSGQLVSYQLNSECKGYYFTPKAAGKYPTVIAIHGAGGVNSFKEKLLSSYNDWVKQGYIPPMVVVIPEVLPTYNGGSSGYDMQDFKYFIQNTYTKRFDTLLKSIEDGSLSPQIGTDKSICVTGFSMGGMAAIYAGAQFPTRIKYVGGLSPSQAFYLGENGSGAFYKKAADIHFSDAPDAHVYMSGGKAEDGGAFITNITRYKNAISVNNPNIAITYSAPRSWGGHAWALAQKELFMYMYFVSCGEIPSEKLVEKVCNNPDKYKVPTVVDKEETHT